MEGTDDGQNTKIRRSRILVFGELLFRDTLGHLYFPCSLQVDATFFRRLRLPSSRRNTPKPPQSTPAPCARAFLPPHSPRLMLASRPQTPGLS
jgi:hypothetical protein